MVWDGDSVCGHTHVIVSNGLQPVGSFLSDFETESDGKTSMYLSCPSISVLSVQLFDESIAATYM